MAALVYKDARIMIDTRAKGMLAKLAHDLSITARGVRATAAEEAGQISVELRVDVASVEVDGVLKGSQVDRSVLSASDKRDIHKKIREEVLTSPEVVVTMRAAASLAEGSRVADATGRIEVGRKSAPLTSRFELEVKDAIARVRGRARVSLSALSIPAPKGPLGAFRVDDEVEISWELAFTIG